MIYFDNAATTLQKPPQVAEAVKDAILTMGNASRGAHDAALSSMRILYETRSMLCEMFHGDSPERTVFAMNSTMALNTVIQGLFAPGDHVITTALEHNSVLRPLYLMETRGVALTIIPADTRGNIDYDDFEKNIRPSTRAVVCTHASNLTGNVLDLVRIGEICRRHGLCLVVDASQTAGVLPIDMQKMGISVLCFTGHKGLMGPQGTGGLLIKEGVSIRPLMVGGSGVHSYSKTHPSELPTALEAGTLNSHGIAGLHAALTYLKDQGTEKLYEKEYLLMRTFYEGVRTIPSVKVYGDFDSGRRAPIITLNIGDYDSGQVSDELLTRFHIATRAGAHCAPLMHEALGTKEQGAVRFSFSHFNTMEEIRQGIEAVRTLATES
ncbi:MAG TPA: aminotransferase class V-fold PLP-dependent enzyme [Candidatus Anaerobutyricum faecale]|nr:aminotransferase class V-fold PLP-dependent enzyme [Candidatus Anaerobutyricum faecale]